MGIYNGVVNVANVSGVNLLENVSWYSENGGKGEPAQDPMSDESLALRLDCKLGDVMTYVVQEFGLLVCHLM